MPQDRRKPSRSFAERDPFRAPDLGDPLPIEKLHIFLQSGRTFTFHRVMIEHSNESVLEFLYKAQSDGGTKKAFFLMHNIAGWSIL